MNKLLVLCLALLAFGLVLGCTQGQPQGNTSAANVDSNSSGSAQTSQAMYTMGEVAQHATSSDCWTVIRGNVYDITSFIGSHPGGSIITEICGKDGTVQFETRPTNGKGPHPPNAEEVLKTLQIGVLRQ